MDYWLPVEQHTHGGRLTTVKRNSRDHPMRPLHQGRCVMSSFLTYVIM